MSDSTTFRVDPSVRKRLEALADVRHMTPSALLAELVTQAETTQLVAEVNTELERLADGSVSPRRQRAQMRRVEATLAGWMRD